MFGAGALLAMVIVIGMVRGGDERSLLVAAVQEGPFEVSIVESATLHALRSVSYSSSIPGNQAKILFLAPEGSTVKRGDPLVRFDPTPFEEELRRAEAQLAQARAELVKAEQDLKLMRLRNKEELAEAGDKLRLAELELASVTDGKGKLAEAESATKLAQARRELEKAISNYEDLKPFLEEGFITKLELDRARQAVDKAREDLELLEVRHQTYIDYTRPAEIEGARAALHNRKEGLRQLEQAASYRYSQTEAALTLAQSKVSELGGKLELQKQNVQNSEIRATVAGMVIYKEVFFGSDKRKVQVGDQVWPNQPIVMVPDLSQMVAETQIRETDIHKVEKNQRVVIFVEAYPELRLEGEVSFIGTLAQEEQGGPAGKYFQVTVLVRKVDPRLRPGMSARVELLVEQIERARFVPLESVFERAGRRYCYVLRKGRAEVQEVLTGPSNENHIVIEAGLDPGERVLLRDPSDEGGPLGSEGTGFLDIVSPAGSSQ
jgi:HlyD family secretion protein